MATTLLQITDEFYSIVGQEADDGSGKNVVYDLTFVENLANTVQQEILREWRFPFMRTKLQFNTGIDTTLTAALATTDTTLSVGATASFETAGAVWIQNDIVDYTGKTSTTLTGATNIDIDHTSGTDVEFLKAFPTDFSHNPELFVGRSGTSKMLPYLNIPEDDFDFSLTRRRWSRVIDKNGDDFIRINNTSNSDIAVFWYYRTPPTMTSSVDASIPDEFAKQVIARKMAGTAMLLRDDNPDNLGSQILEKAEQEIQRMRRFYAMQLGADSIRFRTKYKSEPPFRRRRTIRGHGNF